MIGTDTYLGQAGFYANLLAAYSALDHSTTAEMSDDAVAGAARRTLCRLAALLALHGDSVPSRFLADLSDARDHELDVAATVASYLETGGLGLRSQRESWELQQELVHFSRIVDVDLLDLGESSTERALVRLRGSQRLPDPLKVLSELMIVTRSRLMQRGATVESPKLRVAAPAGSELDEGTTVCLSPEGDYLVVVASPRRRTHRQMAFMFTALLNYLTPVEAAMALWAGVAGEGLHRPVELATVSIEDSGRYRSVHWAHDGQPAQATEDPISWSLARLPALADLAAPGGSLAFRRSPSRVLYTVGGDLDAPVLARVESPGKTKTMALDSGADRSRLSLAQMRAVAGDLVHRYMGAEVLSVECGHIHLDRALDDDQETGVALGATVIETLQFRQGTRPVLVPMMDDDHVLVRLTPATYRAFVEERLPDETMHLVPESSPIVRSIVCALWSRLHADGRAGHCSQRGGNVFFRLPSGSHCELFESFDGVAATGCVLFECALLVYRSAAGVFDSYFVDRFGLQTGVHEQACALLSLDEPHDAKVDRLQRFYAHFGEVTDPHQPDLDVVRLIDHVLTGASAPLTHLNVLEDYYEVQQDKVRALLDALGLPIRLLTLAFSAHTGRVTLHG